MWFLPQVLWKKAGLKTNFVVPVYQVGGGCGVYMEKLPHNLFTLEVPEINSKFCAWNYPNIWGKGGGFGTLS